MNQILVIMGPTASGKSDLAIQMAERYNGEIISADALQIYRHLDIGTAKVSAAEQATVPHHLVDILDMTDTYSVAEFVEQADQIIKQIIQRGRLPIIVGGTGFYIKALLGLQPLDYQKSDTALLQKLKTLSLSELVTMLGQVAPDQLTKIDLHNPHRVQRAILIAQSAQKSNIERPSYDALVVGVDWPREVLYERINTRVDKMLAMGLLDEAKTLLEQGGTDLQAGKAIGYKELFPYLLGQTTLAVAKQQLQQNSRRYAKRQLTYLRHQIDGLIWIDGNTAQYDTSVLVDQWLKKSSQL